MREISSYTRTDESNVTTASPNSPGHAALGSGPVGRDERSNRFFHKTGSLSLLRWINSTQSAVFPKNENRASIHNLDLYYTGGLLSNSAVRLST